MELTFTLEETKKAFWDAFHGMGERFFPDPDILPEEECHEVTKVEFFDLLVSLLKIKGFSEREAWKKADEILHVWS